MSRVTGKRKIETSGGELAFGAHEMRRESGCGMVSVEEVPGNRGGGHARR